MPFEIGISRAPPSDRAGLRCIWPNPGQIWPVLYFFLEKPANLFSDLQI
jgi:hypothetical protein